MIACPLKAAQSELDGSLDDLWKFAALAGVTDPDFAKPFGSR